MTNVIIIKKLWQIVTYANLSNYNGLGAYRLILCYNSTKKKKSSISKKLSKPKIWRANPQKRALTISLIHCSLAKIWLLMNSSSLGLMTYYSLAKELMEIKKFNTPIKIFNFYSTITTATTQHSRSFLSQTSLNSITIKIQTQITILKLIKSEQKMKKKKQKTKQI